MSLWNEKDPDAFPSQPQLPELSRKACLSPRGLRSFFTASRHSSDDVLRQRINSLINDKVLSKDKICNQFATEVIFPSWRARLSAIEFCEEESKTIQRQLEENSEPELQRIIENSDLRIDPYAQREIETIRENKYRELNSLKNWVENEKSIESIVQKRSQEILRDTCGKDDWIKSFNNWMNTLK